MSNPPIQEAPPAPDRRGDAAREEVVPILEERVVVDKREVERVAATVRLRTDVEDVPVTQTLRREEVDIERVPLDQLVDAPPAPREEDGVTIIPIIEEVLVKRYRVIEEVRLRVRAETTEVSETVRLRRQVVDIEEGGDAPSDPRTAP